MRLLRWVDRSARAFEAVVYRCPRRTCVPSQSNLTCWGGLSKRRGQGQGKVPAPRRCAGSDLQCLPGSHAPLCGSCTVGFLYKAGSKICEPCSFIGPGTYAVIVLVLALAALAALVASKRYPCLLLSSPVQILGRIDSGALKVVWVTYQIIISTTISLHITVSAFFSKCSA